MPSVDNMTDLLPSSQTQPSSAVPSQEQEMKIESTPCMPTAAGADCARMKACIPHSLLCGRFVPLVTAFVGTVFDGSDRILPSVSPLAAVH